MVTKIKKGTSAKKIRELLSKNRTSKGIDAHKHVGKIKLKKDALDIQLALRDEWE
jgi:hypothetical protein